MPTIAIKNESTVVSDRELTPVVNALAYQINHDLNKFWGLSAWLMQVFKGQPAPAGAWQLILRDTSDDPTAEGYHTETSDGMPIGYSFPKTNMADGVDWRITLSHELCLSGDTEIALLTGETVAIKDLINRPSFWVYACKENGELRPGRAHSVRITRKNAQLVRVTLDNGESIKCTPDHRFMLRDGSFTEAQALQSNTSLMPLYRRLEKMTPTKKGTKGYEYEQVYVPAKNDWVFTHRMVVPYCSSGYVRHHADFNRFNNSPDNLKVLKWEDHRLLHSQHIGHYAKLNKGKPHNVSAEARAAAAIRGRALFLKYNGSEKHKADMARYWTPERRQQAGQRLKLVGHTSEVEAEIAERSREPHRRNASAKRMTAYNKSDTHREIARQLGTKMFNNWWSCPEYRAKAGERAMRGAHSRFHLPNNKPNSRCQDCTVLNHKVVSVEWLTEREDVYDLTVDKYHTFATTAGVFVHNCELRCDPWTTYSAQGIINGQTVFRALECADPCEDDQFSYLIGSVPVSDFVTPRYFEDSSISGPYDMMGHVTHPGQLLTNGYQSYFDVAKNAWTDITADHAPNYKPPFVGSRRWLRQQRHERNLKGLTNA